MAGSTAAKSAAMMVASMVAAMAMCWVDLTVGLRGQKTADKKDKQKVELWVGMMETRKAGC